MTAIPAPQQGAVPIADAADATKQMKVNTDGSILTNTPAYAPAVVFKSFAASAITAGTAVTIWTPTSGKKFRLLGYSLSLSVAGYLIFKDNTTVILNSAAVTAGANTNSGEMRSGILSAAADNTLKIDVSASGNVSGWVMGTEE